jgi:hypothetical protein
MKLLLFLSHAGKAVWQTDEPVLTKEQIQTEYLQPNGFHTKRMWISDDIVYIEVDKENTNVSSFYTWEEALACPEKPECWRAFYFFQDAIQAHLWMPDTDYEIQGLGSLWSLYTVLRDMTIKN